MADVFNIVDLIRNASIPGFEAHISTSYGVPAFATLILSDKVLADLGMHKHSHMPHEERAVAFAKTYRMALGRLTRGGGVEYKDAHFVALEAARISAGVVR